MTDQSSASQNLQLRIGEIAQQFGITVGMLRRYEAKGLLQPQRDAQGNRFYRMRDVARLEVIIALARDRAPLSAVAAALRGERDSDLTSHVSITEKIELLKFRQTAITAAIVTLVDLAGTPQGLPPFADATAPDHQKVVLASGASKANEASGASRMSRPGTQTSDLASVSEERKMIDTDLVSRWKAAHRPDVASPTELIYALAERYCAYRIPSEVYSQSMYANDPQLRGAEAVIVMTVTHPAVLRTLFTENDRALQVTETEAIEECARSLFLGYPHDSENPISGDFLNMEHGLGRRVSVAIATAAEHIVGYRLLGRSEQVAQMLRAFVPVFVAPEIRRGHGYDTDEFEAYLRDLAAADRI